MGAESSPSEAGEEAAADFAAQWQTDHPGGAQVSAEYEPDTGNLYVSPPDWPDGESEK